MMGMCCSVSDKLSEEDLKFIKRCTRFEAEVAQEWYIGFLQECPSGKLSKKAFLDMYKTFYPHGDCREFCENVFRTFVTDKNGTIDFREFLLAIDITSAGTPRERMLWAYRSRKVRTLLSKKIQPSSSLPQISVTKFA